MQFVVNTNAENYPWHMKWETDTNALLVFIKALQVYNGTLGKLYIDLWKKLPGGMRKHLTVPLDAEKVRANAVRGIDAIRDAVLDKNVMDAWVLATRDKDPMVRWWATVELKQMGPNMAIAAGIK